jgi:hypothetical protein
MINKMGCIINPQAIKILYKSQLMNLEIKKIKKTKETDRIYCRIIEAIDFKMLA